MKKEKVKKGRQTKKLAENITEFYFINNITISEIYNQHAYINIFT